MTLKVTGAALVAWLVASFAIPKLLGLKSRDQWILFAALSVIGVFAAAAAVWWNQRKKAAAESNSGGAAQALDPADELARYLHDAEARLAAAKQLTRGTRFGNLPVMFIMGPQGAAKTTTIVKAGIEAELLAGQVFQDTQIVPTRLANIWFARQAVFVEPARSLLHDKNRWLSLIRRMQPGKLSSVMNRGAQAPRAVVVMFDCERLYASGSSSGPGSAARELHAQLSEISQQLGVALPVYVLFTKADRIPFFLDYVHAMQDSETAQLLGAALPLPNANRGGSYEEEQTARINEAFNQIYYSLAEKRLEFLARDNDPSVPPVGYEFPRELRKLRTAAAQFLVDLCRPSQLSVGPFLRGFYFSGVRPVMVREAVQAPQRPALQSFDPAAAATAIFRPGQMQPAQATAAPELLTKRVPQWVFLRRLFSDVVLADDIGLRESGANVKTNLLRRVLLTAAAAVCLVLLTGFTISFLNNRSLESQVRNAAAGIATAPSTSAEIPSLDALRRLDQLRESLKEISDYNRDGAPFWYGWGLSVGNDLLPEARAIYFGRFRQLLLDGVQQRLLMNLKSLPLSPGASDGYADPYNWLKSYLTTTSHHEKSTVSYLAPELAAFWQAGRDIDADRVLLARKQFDFYSGELQYANPYSSQNDRSAVEHARHYLGQFAGIERVYRNVLAEINKNNPALNFNQKFPGATRVVTNAYDVPGAYTMRGFAGTTGAIKQVNKYFAGDQWVLGDQPALPADLAKLQQELTARYTADYIDTWRKYLNAGQVVSYASIPDAARKLGVNAGPESPVLGMMCLASQNTDSSEAISNAFRTLHKVVPPACSTGYIGGSNADYMKSLAGLQVSLEQIGAQKPDPADPMVAAASNSANIAKTSMIQLTQQLGVDPNAHLEGKIQQLLEAPIKYTDPLLRGLAPAALNGKGAGLCAEMRPLLMKYPFNPQSAQDASISEINGIFKPGDGALWKFYDENLAKSLTRAGDPIPGGGFTYNQRFLGFFHRAAAFSNSAYAAGAQVPKIDFSLRAVPSDDIQSLRLNVAGVIADFPAGSSEPHRFTWPGATQIVTLSGVSKSTGSFTRPYEGLWAAFRFFADANRAPAGGTGVYEWDQKFGLTARTLFVVKFDLNMTGAPPVFQKGYFAGLSCVSDIATSR
jgi:type VI secretion system protein ImpL